MAEEKKTTITIVRSKKNAEIIDKLVDHAKKLGCSLSGLVNAAVEQYMANPPEEVPEIAKGNARAVAPGFWLAVETDEEGKPKKVLVQEVAQRGDAQGKEFFRINAGKDGQISDKAFNTAKAKAVEAATQLCTWTGLKFGKTNLKLLK